MSRNDTHESVDRKSPSPYEEKRGAVMSSTDGPERGMQTEFRKAKRFVFRVEGKPGVANRRSETSQTKVNFSYVI